MGSVGALETSHGRGRRARRRRDVRYQVGLPAGWRDGSRCRENPSERGVCDYLGVSEERAGEAIPVSVNEAHGGLLRSRLWGDAITVFGWCFADISVRCSPFRGCFLWIRVTFCGVIAVSGPPSLCWISGPFSFPDVFKLCWFMLGDDLNVYIGGSELLYSASY